MSADIVWPDNEREHSLPEAELQISDSEKPTDKPQAAERISPSSEGYFIHMFIRIHTNIISRAADQGLEPQLTAPEAVVLPLDESAITAQE